MKFIKNTFFSLALIYSCSLLSSAPAQVIIDVEVLERSLEEYQKEITPQMARIKDLCQKRSYIKDLHEQLNQSIQSSVENQCFKKISLELQQNGADREELSLLQNKINQSEKEASTFLRKADLILNHVAEPSHALAYYVCLKNIYLSKAGYLQETVNTQKTKIEQQAKQIQVAHSEIQQQAAHISALQAELRQLKNPNEQQLADKGELPAAPGGVQIKKK